MESRDTRRVESMMAAADRGEPGATDALYALLYDQIHRLARQRLGAARASATLTPTALVHDAYLRLAGRPLPELADRHHFLALVARVMRQVLVDHARRRQALKRGQDPFITTLVEEKQAASGTTLSAVELLALDRALEALDHHDREMARVVELRYFGGLSVAETAQALNCSRRTVNRRWQASRAWLALHLSDG